MSTTPNLGLEKSLESTYYDVEVRNRNMDKIDTAVKGVQDKFTLDGKAINADKLDGKDATEFAPASHTHTPDQAGAAPSSHTHTAAQVGASPASHATDSNMHVVAADKTNWNSKAAGNHNHAGVYEPANGNIVKTNQATIMTAELKANGALAIGTAQVRNIYAGTSDMTAGVTALATGAIYFVYE